MIDDGIQAVVHLDSQLVDSFQAGPRQFGISFISSVLLDFRRHLFRREPFACPDISDELPALEAYTLDRMRAELVESNAAIERLLGVSPVSFAYPCGQKYVGRGSNLKSYVPLVAEHFLSGRGWMDEWANDPAYCDMAQLMAMEVDGKRFEQIKELIDRRLADGGWLILAGHEINDDGRQTTQMSTLRALCEYAQDPANGLWLDTVEAVTRHIQRQRAGKAG